MENLYNYLFWYNCYESLWYAIDRNTLTDFFGGSRKNSKYYSSKDHATLVELLCKEGLMEKVESQEVEE